MAVSPSVLELTPLLESLCESPADPTRRLDAAPTSPPSGAADHESSVTILRAAANNLLSMLEAAEEDSAQWWARAAAVPQPQAERAARACLVQTRLVFDGGARTAGTGRLPSQPRLSGIARLWPYRLRTASQALLALVA